MIERERRFLVSKEGLEVALKYNPSNKYLIKQGYVCADDKAVVRIRSIQPYAYSDMETSWYLTIKKDIGCSDRVEEYEFEIAHGHDLFHSLEKTIEKIRYTFKLYGLWIELDVFKGRHLGLIIAEVELQSDEESAILDTCIPAWFGEEITGNKSYSNYQLSKAD